MCVFIRYYSLSVKLCACSLVCNNCRWNCERIHSFKIIFGGHVVVFSSLYRFSVELR